MWSPPPPSQRNIHQASLQRKQSKGENVEVVWKMSETEKCWVRFFKRWMKNKSWLWCLRGVFKWEHSPIIQDMFPHILRRFNLSTIPLTLLKCLAKVFQISVRPKTCVIFFLMQWVQGYQIWHSGTRVSWRPWRSWGYLCISVFLYIFLHFFAFYISYFRTIWRSVLLSYERHFRQNFHIFQFFLLLMERVHTP